MTLVDVLSSSPSHNVVKETGMAEQDRGDARPAWLPWSMPWPNQVHTASALQFDQGWHPPPQIEDKPCCCVGDGLKTMILAVSKATTP